LNEALVAPTFIDLNVSVTSKRQLLHSLAQRVAEPYGVEEREVLSALQDREQEGPTGAGDGVAIPHAKLPGLNRTVTYFARLQDPVSYDSHDDIDVDLVFLILAPETANGDHLKLLARVSRAFKDPTFCERLRGAEDAAALDILLNEV
jgi:PTS system nitrogen regulatory IIA component